MREQIGLGALKDIEVLYRGDIYDMACLLLKIHDAQDKGTNCRSRHTMHGLATTYAMVAEVNPDKIEDIFKRHGLPLGATVEHSADVRESR